jgi:succinate dehydrogenase flavin-adding protein (antitoxin of CptAB toxin-antitoxin module)
MKELDLLLERFARERYAGASAERREAFERLLTLPDPVLVELLLLEPDPTAPASSEALAATADAEVAAVAALVAAAGRR